MNVLPAIRWIGQAWEALEPSTIIKCFANAGLLDKERNVVEAVEPPSDEDPFADLEDEVSQVEMLLNDSCGNIAVSPHEAIASESLLQVCQGSYQVCHQTQTVTMKVQTVTMKKS